MNGVLAFTLGLEASPLLRGARAGTSAINTLIGTAARFTGVTAAMTAAFETFRQGGNVVKGVFEAIQRGADLQRLHARTGETVADLFLLQRGFKAVGMETGEVGPMLFHLQKSLSGISDIGEDTAGAFGILGLNMMDLRRQNAPQQFEQIAMALNRLNAAQAAAVSGRIFGREGAANFLQLARSGQAFGAALRDNAAAAQQMARDAAAFNTIELTLVSLKNKAQDFFAGIAEGAAPGIQKVLDALNRIDLSSIGKKFGDVIAGFGQAIEDHKLGELLKLSLNAGVEAFENFFMATLSGLAVAIEKLFQNLKLSFANLMRPSLMFLAGGGGPMGGLMGGAGAGDYARGVAQTARGTAEAFAGGFADSMRNGNHAAETAFAALIQSLSARARARMTADNTSAPGISGLPAKPFDFTSIEKMGFIFGKGGPTLMQDHARATADNTRRTAVATERLVSLYGLTGLGLFSGMTLSNG